MKKTTFLLISFMLIFIATYAQKNIAPSDSMILVKYYKLKGPNLDKTWQVEDYQKAAEVIQELKLKGVEYLPRKKGAFSGKILTKMLNHQNYDSLTRNNLFIDVRLQSVLGVTRAVSSVFQLYFNSSSHKTVHTFSNEIMLSSVALTELTGLQIQMIRQLLEKKPELNEDDESLVMIKTGLTTFIEGSLTTIIKEYNYYEREDIVLFASHFFPFYYSLREPLLTNDTKQSVDKRIKNTIETHPYKEVRRAARNKNKLDENN